MESEISRFFHVFFSHHRRHKCFWTDKSCWNSMWSIMKISTFNWAQHMYEYMPDPWFFTCIIKRAEVLLCLFVWHISRERLVWNIKMRSEGEKYIILLSYIIFARTHKHTKKFSYIKTTKTHGKWKTHLIFLSNNFSNIMTQSRYELKV